MTSLPFFQVDAFADRPLTGNPAAVMPLDRWLDDALMQAIAAENNLSETAFTVPSDREKGQWLARFLWWAIHDGQRFSTDLDYARLPDKVVARIEGKLRALRSGETRLLEGV